MNRQIALLLAFYFQFVSLSAVFASVQQTDEIALERELGIPVYRWKDPSVKTKAIIVAFHGMTFYGLAFKDTASYLASEGYPVYSFDFRGFGRWHSDSKGYPSDGKVHFDQSINDAQSLISIIHEKNPQYKIFCLGESLGSNLALSLIAKEGQPIDGAILCGLGVRESLHPEFRWLIDFYKGVTGPNKPFNLEPYIKPNLSSDPELTNIYLHDPNIYRKMSTVELVKAIMTNRRSIKTTENIPSSMPLLIISGEKDRIFKLKALKQLCQKLGPDRTTLKIIPNEGHLLLELKLMKPEVATTIDGWLEKETQVKEADLKEPVVEAKLKDTNPTLR